MPGNTFANFVEHRHDQSIFSALLKKYGIEPMSNESYFHPTFLYESLWNVGVFAILIFAFLRFPKLRTGTITMFYAIVYSLGRFWIEGLRMDSLMVGGLRTAQIISLSAIAAGIFGLIWLYGLRRRFPDTTPKALHLEN